MRGNMIYLKSALQFLSPLTRILLFDKFASKAFYYYFPLNQNSTDKKHDDPLPPTNKQVAFWSFVRSAPTALGFYLLASDLNLISMVISAALTTFTIGTDILLSSHKHKYVSTHAKDNIDIKDSNWKERGLQIAHSAREVIIWKTIRRTTTILGTFLLATEITPVAGIAAIAAITVTTSADIYTTAMDKRAAKKLLKEKDMLEKAVKLWDQTDKEQYKKLFKKDIFEGIENNNNHANKWNRALWKVVKCNILEDATSLLIGLFGRGRVDSIFLTLLTFGYTTSTLENSIKFLQENDINKQISNLKQQLPFNYTKLGELKAHTETLSNILGLNTSKNTLKRSPSFVGKHILPVITDGLPRSNTVPNLATVFSFTGNKLTKSMDSNPNDSNWQRKILKTDKEIEIS
jgi:hypothetical protein